MNKTPALNRQRPELKETGLLAVPSLACLPDLERPLNLLVGTTQVSLGLQQQAELGHAHGRVEVLYDQQIRDQLGQRCSTVLWKGGVHCGSVQPAHEVRVGYADHRANPDQITKGSEETRKRHSRSGGYECIGKLCPP